MWPRELAADREERLTGDEEAREVRGQRIQWVVEEDATSSEQDELHKEDESQIVKYDGGDG